MGDHESRGAAADRRPGDKRTDGHQGVTDLLKASNDIVLIVDDGGIVRDIAIDDAELAEEIGSAWLDQPLIDTVTVESRGKVQRMLDATDGSVTRQEVNHTLGAEDLPVRYAAVRLAPEGPVAVLGRDLRDIARLQQQLVDANLAVERDYALHRATEIQFRVLFQQASEPVLIADATSRRILDVNPRAEDLLRRTHRQLLNTEVEKLFLDVQGRAVLDGFAAARAVGQAVWPGLVPRQGGASLRLTAWLIRSSGQPQLLLQLAAETTPPLAAVPRFGARWEALRAVPDALVATDEKLFVTDANESFLDLVGAATPDGVRGAPLSRFLGRHDLGLLAARLEPGGMVRHLPVSIRDLHGASQPCDLSGAALGTGAASRCFVIRPRAVPPVVADRHTLKAADEMTSLVGRMPLRDIVRETADIIEELCIEAALELTDDNRAMAAEVLGLSRQSLYAKMRRYSLGNLPGDDADA